MTKELGKITWDLAHLHEASKAQKTATEIVAAEILDQKWAHLDAILWDLWDIAQYAETSDPKWFPIADHKTRLRAIKLLLDVRGDIVNKSGKINVQVGFNQLITTNGSTTKPDNYDEIIIPDK